MHPRGLLLDLGNVLVFHDNALLFRNLASLFQVDVHALAAGFDAPFWREVNCGRLPGHNLRLAMEQRLGRPVEPVAFEAAWSSHFRLNTPMLEWLERHRNERPLGLLSNTHDLHVKHLLPQLPLLQHFEARVLSCEVGIVKPDSAIYLHAASLLQLPPADILYVDDIPAYADAASSVGMRSCVFEGVAELETCLVALAG